MTRSIAERIKTKIERRDGHWIWTGQMGPRPVLSGVSVRRFLFEQKHGPVDGAYVMLDCGEERCVNPAHARAYESATARKTQYNQRNYDRHRDSILAQQAGYRESLRS